MNKITTCLWFDGKAEEAANFYASVFPDSAVTAIHRAPADYPAGKAGDVLTVEFTVCGQSFIGLNGGGGNPFTDAVSFQIFTDDQAETDRYWNAIVSNGGTESACSWCRDRYGLAWQIVPRVLMAALANPDQAAAARAMQAMMTMRKIDIAAIEAALAGEGAA